MITETTTHQYQYPAFGFADWSRLAVTGLRVTACDCVAHLSTQTNVLMVIDAHGGSSG